jgi:hypothetical protein
MHQPINQSLDPFSLLVILILNRIFLHGNQLCQLPIQDPLADSIIFNTAQELIFIYWVAVDLEHHYADLVEYVQFVDMVTIN